MPLPFPQRIFSRVTDITPALLAGLGVRGILLDIDGTIAPTHTPLPPQEVQDWLDTLKQAGILVYILSNNRHEARVRTLAQALSGQIADLFPGWVLPSNNAQDKIKKKEVTT